MPCDAQNASADGLVPCDADNAGADGLGCRMMQRMLVPMVWDAV